MEYNYKEYVPHGITFINTTGDKKHTWRDWKVVPTSRPVFKPPNAKRVEVEIPGADSIIDMTESLTGEVHYNNRSGSLEFQVENKNNWYDVYSDILDYIHGQQMKAVLDDEPTYYYIGRFSVNEWKSDKMNSKIVIDYSVEPYKLEMFSSLEDWEWDSFNFETGIIREYKNIRVDGSLTLTIEGRRKTVIPLFAVKTDDGKEFDVEFNGKNFNIPDGTSKILGIVFKEGSNTLKIMGNGTISIDYRGGRL